MTSIGKICHSNIYISNLVQWGYVYQKRNAVFFSLHTPGGVCFIIITGILFFAAKYFKNLSWKTVRIEYLRGD